MKKITGFLIILMISIVLLSGCNTNQTSTGETKVKLGVSSIDGPVWQMLQEKSKEEGIDLEIVELSDWQLPNDALSNGEIDMNAFQHIAFLSQYNIQKNKKLTPIGARSIVPKGLYSEKYSDVSEIPDGAEVAIANDAANMGLDLLLLQEVGLIQLDEKAGLFATPDDIIENPKNLQIETINPQQTARILSDVDLTAIYTSTAYKAGIDQEQALYVDDPLDHDGYPYVGVFVVRAEDTENETYQKVAKLIQDSEIKEALRKDTNGLDEIIEIPVEDLQSTLDQLMGEGDVK